MVQLSAKATMRLLNTWMISNWWLLATKLHSIIPVTEETLGRPTKRYGMTGSELALRLMMSISTDWKSKSSSQRTQNFYTSWIGKFRRCTISKITSCASSTSEQSQVLTFQEQIFGLLLSWVPKSTTTIEWALITSLSWCQQEDSTVHSMWCSAF